MWQRRRDGPSRGCAILNRPVEWFLRSSRGSGNTFCDYIGGMFYGSAVGSRDVSTAAAVVGEKIEKHVSGRCQIV